MHLVSRLFQRAALHRIGSSSAWEQLSVAGCSQALLSRRTRPKQHCATCYDKPLGLTSRANRKATPAQRCAAQQHAWFSDRPPTSRHISRHPVRAAHLSLLLRPAACRHAALQRPNAPVSVLACRPSPICVGVSTHASLGHCHIRSNGRQRRNRWRSNVSLACNTSCGAAAATSTVQQDGVQSPQTRSDDLDASRGAAEG